MVWLIDRAQAKSMPLYLLELFISHAGILLEFRSHSVSEPGIKVRIPENAVVETAFFSKRPSLGELVLAEDLIVQEPDGAYE
uniref:Uncharacterized protein n=1 Tax=Ignisphaera aggregans TaxID=334771 RepID=A0A7C2V982_9CREN